MKKFLRTSDLAQEAKLSVQAIRNYEHQGFIPTVQRGPQGYRLYEERHLHALRVAQSTIAGFGWQNALRIMNNIHQNNLSAALTIIDAWHAEIHQSRRETEEMLIILRATSTSLLPTTQPSEKNKQKQLLQISAAAQSVGVRVSAVRFWEEQGFLHPKRDRESRYRLYDEEQMRNLQIVVLLRKTGYNFAAIRIILQELAEGTPEQALAAAENRLKELAEKSQRCMKAAAALWAYFEKYFC